MSDTDIKIATPRASSRSNIANLEADSVKEYIYHRKLGNIELAHRLGRRLAAGLPDAVWADAPHSIDPDSFETQLMILYAYVAVRTLEKDCPNQTLAHTAMGRFYDELEERHPVFFDRLADSGSFSLYLYLDRMGAETADTVGSIFANQCGGDNIKDCARLGSESYERFGQLCQAQLAETVFRR